VEEASRRRRSLDLSALYSRPEGELRLASLVHGRIECLAHRYTLIIPLFSEESGEELFSTRRDVPGILRLLSARFGGCTVVSSTRGTWLSASGETVASYLSLHLYVYAKCQEDGPVVQFFQYLKERLRRFGNQEEVTLERFQVELLPGRILR
jgi:hypothetical protein